MQPRGSRKPPSRHAAPQRRENTVRVSAEVARRVRDGHPWIFEDALRGRRLTAPRGTPFAVVDPTGAFAGQALCDAHGSVVLRVFSRRRDEPFGAAYLQAAVDRAASWRRSQLDIGDTACVRVLYGDSEGIPAVNVDRYAGYLVISAYSPLVEGFMGHLLSGLRGAWQPRGIYLQRRYEPVQAGKMVPGAELVDGLPALSELVVTEGPLRFVVDVTAPLGTGLFLDMRLGRQAVMRLAAGRATLNCFSYTGAFSVAAAACGASRVVSIDSAPRAHGRAVINFRENGLDPDAKRCEFLTGDAFATMEQLRAKGQRFDLVILDPPPFSQDKGRTFTTLKDYAELATGALGLVAPRGVLCAASNAAKLSESDFDRALGRASSAAGRRLSVVQRVSQPPDFPTCPGFPESNYLKFYVLVAD